MSQNDLWDTFLFFGRLFIECLAIQSPICKGDFALEGEEVQWGHGKEVCFHTW